MHLKNGGLITVADENGDLLQELKTDMCWIKKIMSNHLKHHWAITLAAFAAGFTGFATALVVILKELGGQ